MTGSGDDRPGSRPTTPPRPGSGRRPADLARAARTAGRCAWWASALLAGGLGLGWISLLASPGLVLAVIAAVTGGDAVLQRLAAHDAASTPARSRWIAAAGISAAAFAAVGLLLALQDTGMWILVLLGMTSPMTWAALRRLLAARTTVGAPAPAPAPSRTPAGRPAAVSRPDPHLVTTQPTWLSDVLPDLLDVVDDRELCWLWRASFPLLGRATSPAELDIVVGARRAYLDELERRHAVSIGRWLSHGARPAGDPSRFLT